MAFGESGARGVRSIFDRIVGTGTAKNSQSCPRRPFARWHWVSSEWPSSRPSSWASFLMIAGVPFAGLLALIVLVLGIAQVPALLVTLPVIVYIWMSGDYGTAAAVTHTVLLFVAGMLDNVLKPLLLGRGVDAPMAVILLGALGGLATARHPGNVRRSDLAGPGLSDLHVVGRYQSGEGPTERKSQAAS